jgi:hypothetical protein
MKNSLLYMSLLIAFSSSSPASASESLMAEIRVQRSFVEWNGLQASIRQEEVCRQTLPLLLADRRAESKKETTSEEALSLSCPTLYKDLPVNAKVTGIWEWVKAEGFTTSLPKEQSLNRLYFNLNIEAPANFPYLAELQNMAVFQTLGESLEQPRPFLFGLSSESYVVVSCSHLGCESNGPEATYRAEVRVFSNR